jgi:uncharacterized membrane protein (UPF0127 family)
VPRRLRRLPALALAAGVRLLVADRRRARLLGLAGLRAPPVGVALLLVRCRCIHTAAMRWPLDLVWLGRDGGVVRVDRGVPPWRVRGCLAAGAVIEVPAGAADGVVAALARDGLGVAAVRPG